MKGLRPLSILLGVVVDKLLAVLSIGLLMALLGPSSFAFQVLALVAGSGCTAFGAYVAGRHASARPLAHGVAVGCIALVLSVARFALTPLLASADSPPSHSLGWNVLAWLSVGVSGWLGGKLAARR